MEREEISREILILPGGGGRFGLFVFFFVISFLNWTAYISGSHFFTVVHARNGRFTLANEVVIVDVVTQQTQFCVYDVGRRGRGEVWFVFILIEGFWFWYQ